MMEPYGAIVDLKLDRTALAQLHTMAQVAWIAVKQAARAVGGHGSSPGWARPAPAAQAGAAMGRSRP